MKKTRGSFYALLLMLGLCAAALIVPVLRGTPPLAFGLDLSGGVIVTYRPDFSKRLDTYADLDDGELLALAKETLTSRLARKLSTIPDVVVRGDQRIVVSIPSRDDPRHILELVGETYQLTLRLVVDGGEPFDYHGRRLGLAAPAFSGDMLDESSIRVETASQGSLDVREMAPKVAFRFRPPHDAEFADFTGRHVGGELAILLDDEVEWVGTIESAISGPGVLRGGYSFEEAADVAMMLKSGTLPVSLEVESLEAVGPSLGQEIRELGVEALALAVALLVALIAVAYLHRSAFVLAGLVSLGCLLLLIAGLAAAFRLTLDVAGIAGIVLSVGMGMDAFILVFEALAAESYPARSTAARRVYSFAGEGRTLFHANATTVLVIALLLFTERLKSFAVFIFVGLFASVVTIFITRRLLERTYGRLPDFGPDLLAGPRRWRPRAFRLRKLYYLAVAGLLAFALLKGPVPELGADFKAGTQVFVASHREEDVQAAIGKMDDGVAVRWQRLGEPGRGRYLLTLGTALDDPGDADELIGRLESESVDVESLSSIDGKVSSRRLFGSFSVFALSFVLLAVYFVGLQPTIDGFFSRTTTPPVSATARARILAGVLLALAVDVAVVLAVLALSAVPISLPVVAALLTIIGYSVNDSVVLWSHVRSRADAEAASPEETVTRSVDGILSRALLTSLSTMVPALTILAVGLEPLRDFAWAMIAGTVAGTLSSIFLVGSFAVWALKASGKRRP